MLEFTNNDCDHVHLRCKDCMRDMEEVPAVPPFSPRITLELNDFLLGLNKLHINEGGDMMKGMVDPTGWISCQDLHDYIVNFKKGLTE